MEPEHRRAVRARLAHLLGHKLERLVSDAGLVTVARDPRKLQSAIERLQQEFGVSLDPRALAAARTVNHLVTLVADAVREGRRAAPRGPTALEPAHALEQLVEGPSASEPPGAEAPASRQPKGEVYASAVAYEAARIGAAAVYCSDGRVGEQMDDFLHNGLGLPRYDRLACPGGPVALAGRLASFWECHSVEEQLRFLLRVHAVKQVVLVAHQPCAYYLERLAIPPAQLEAEQLKDLQQAAWAVQRADPALEVAGFIAWAEAERIRFEKVLATAALAQRVGGWQSRTRT